MTDLRGILSLRENFSSFQKELQTPDNDGDIYTSYASDFRKSSWSFPIIENLAVMKNEDVIKRYDDTYSKYIVYSVNMKPHTLLRVDLIQKLPAIRCKPGYKAKWVENIGSFIIREVKLLFGEDFLTTINENSLEKIVQSRVKNVESLEVRRGNTPELQNLSEYLEEDVTSFTIPFFFSKRLGSYFPLHYCGYEDNLEIFLDAKSNLKDLIEVYDSNENKVDPEKYIFPVELEKPNLRGYHTIMDKWELDSASCSKESRNIRLVEDFITKESVLNDTMITIKDVKIPVSLISWKLSENVKIISTSLKLSKKIDTLILPEDLTNRDLPDLALLNPLPKVGYHYYPLDVDKNNNDPPSGIPIIDGSINVKLLKKESCYLELCLFVVKKLIFEKVANNEDARKNFRCSYKISF